MAEEYKKISQEEIKKFMEGKDPQERIVNLVYKYDDKFMQVIYRDKDDRKCIEEQPFFPFLWATKEACLKLKEGAGGKDGLVNLMKKFGIGVKKLSNVSITGEVMHEFETGFMFMFYAKNPMSYSDFLKFFKWAKNPVYKKDNGKSNGKDDNRQYLTVTPQEQFLISTGKRFFKGYNDYDDVLRLIFDLETEGLNPEKHRIKLNGVRLNRPVTIKGKTYQDFGRIFKLEGETEEEKNASELKIIDTFLRIIYTFRPDIITAHNGENFDWNFIIVRCKMLGTSIEEMSEKYFGKGNTIYKETRESTLKLGGEIETFYKTVVPNTIVTDSLHAVRRAQAVNSSIKKADLKYISNFLKIKKDNRVYTPGAEIDNILIDKVHQYAFNNTDGDWYIYDPNSPNGTDIEFKKGKNGDKPFVMYTRNYLADGYEITTGEYIVTRYLLDDLWECDRVEYTYNGADFMLSKFIPVPFSKCITMGTAGQWKMLMLAWSYEHNLAIPNESNESLKVGGLSRLLRVGFVKNVIKLDFNSLYPSIILTWAIKTHKDLQRVMLSMLEYVLTNREYYKGIKKASNKVIEKYEKEMQKHVLSAIENKDYLENQKTFQNADNQQNVVKKLGNSNFGAVSAANVAVFPWADVKMGGQITGTGRQSLRLMIRHFHDLGYMPIVGDSVVGDTPLFIRYKDTGYIDIKPIEELMDDIIETDYLGREYDIKPKDYQVLCRSGWCDIQYVYRHKTNKPIYEVTDGTSTVECTEDHSLFDENKSEIKPSQIKNGTKLEYYTNNIEYSGIMLSFTDDRITEMAKNVANGTFDRIPFEILNSSHEYKIKFYREFMKYQSDSVKYSKTCIAGIQFLIKK